MDIPIILQARMSSRRLPGKVLLDVRGKPMMEYSLDRLRRSKKTKKVIVATSTDKRDQPIVDYCRENNVECFRGFLDNVARRFKSIIEEYGMDCFVRICADSPLIDPDVIDTGIEIFRNGDYDIVTNALNRTFPKGQCFEIMHSDTFIKGYEDMKEPGDFEHVTTYFYRNSKKYKIYNLETADHDYSGVNLSVDTEEDLKVFTDILERMDKPFLNYSWQEIAEIHRSIRTLSR